jgi:hypothetical protein
VWKRADSLKVSAHFRKIMKKIKTTKGIYCLVDEDDFEKLNKYRWYFCSMDGETGYAYAKVDGKLVSMHRFLMRFPIGLEIDHINHDKLDNRKQNLRIVSRSENAFNRKIQKPAVERKAKKKEYRPFVHIASSILHL